mgnify:CR=1 FL=1
MATKTTSSTLFRPELTQEIFNKVKGHSTLAKLSGTVPMPFEYQDFRFLFLLFCHE